MSSLYLLLLLAVWLGLAYSAYWLWTRFRPRWAQRKSLYISLGVAAAAVWVLWPLYEVFGKKMYHDAQVRNLCAKDGGINIHESVTLPAERFDRWGMVSFYRPTQGSNALGPEYLFKEERIYYARGNPTVSRLHYEVMRRSDNKVLGETTSYVRGGGDLPGPWQPSSFRCPPIQDAGVNALLMRVFVVSNQKASK